MISSPRITTAPIGPQPTAPASRACSSAAAMPLCTPRLARRTLGGNPLETEGIAVLGPVHENLVALGILPLEDRHRQRVLQHPLDRALQGPRSVYRVVALGDDQLLRRRRDFDRQLAVGQQFLQDRKS